MKTPNFADMKPLAGLFLALAGSAALAAGTGDACAPRLNPLQARIYQQAAAGPGALRDFLFIRRGVLQLDIYEVADWAASIRAERAACLKTVAQAEPSVTAGR